jgi:23S rRNA pseudouridine955/2504/2580 synthase
LKGVPKSRIYRIIRKGELRVNKKRIKPEYKLKLGDEVRIPPIRVSSSSELPPPSTALQTLIKSSILFEDDELLIINKPSGLAVHAGTGVKAGLIEVLRFMFAEQTYLELIHRLDKGTSGCILIAKTAKALKILGQDFKTGNVNKTYHAVVKGQWPASVSKVEAPLYKNRPRSGERFVEISAVGKTALTNFAILENLAKATLIEAKPLTGRTHQIRVHAQSVGHPIMGDEKYSDEADRKLLRKLGICRLLLHAVQIEFEHPISKKRITIKAEYDAQLKQAMQIVSTL